MKNNKSYLGIDAVLLIVFVVLKLCGLINWSLWWVLSPAWISLVLGAIITFTPIVVHLIRNRKKANAGAEPVRCKNCLFSYDYGTGFLNCDLNKCIVHDGDYCGKGVRR